MNPYKGKDLRKFLASIPKEIVDKNTKIQIDEEKRMHQEFISSLKINKCFLCGESMSLFVETRPCFHWFTYPPGIKKKVFEKWLESPISFFQLDSYFRWLANAEKPIGNINDLKDETSKTSYIETTIKYKNIEWAFSIGNTDKDGHPNSIIGSTPHYHIQMKVDANVFLKFNDFHIPFTDTDLFNMELLEQAGDMIRLDRSFGSGISILEDQHYIAALDETLTVTDDEENAPFHRQTLVQAPEGQTISGELVYQAIQESKKTKQPVGKIIQRLMSEVKVTTVITAGKGVPKMTKRNGKK